MEENKTDGVKLTQTAQTVLEKRQYLSRDQAGNIVETPEKMLRRVAENIASADKLYGASEEEIKETEEKFFEVQKRLEFLSGMALRNAGRELQQLSACYVLPIDDSMDSIYTTLKNAAFLHKTGAGIGYDFSKLRPAEDLVRTTGGRSSGPVSFMRLYDFSTETVVNNASTRRAGNMGILRVDHPDILKFISSKEDNRELNNFNISVAVTDEFMSAVKNDTEYDLVNPRTQQPIKKLKAREVFDLIVEKAWASAEPGLIFIDEVNRRNQTPRIGRIEATNLCGEQPLLAYEACNLGSIVLSRMLKKDGGQVEIDWDKLSKVVKTAVRFLDNSVDLNSYPLPEIQKINLGNRKIGLGIMGFADLLYEMGIPYCSFEAVEVAEKIMKFITDEARHHSVRLAERRGSFPNFHKSVWPDRGFKAMRNATVTTIAPNGTTSIIANCSSGIEPVFGLAFVRKNIMDIGEDEFLEVNPVFERVAKEKWFYSRELMKEVAEKGSVGRMPQVPDEVKKVFVTALDITGEWHLRIQAAFQKYTDNAVSKTVNLKADSTRDEVREVFLLAHKLGCKGVTIYRDQSRDRQVLNIGGSEKKEKVGVKVK